MPVSKHISDLTALALKDRVLTLVEKQTIVKSALAEGISEQEINSFLDNALKERLKSYKKEDLKSCPVCGSQIPLISDNCLFCGNSLTNGSGNGKVIKVSGTAAKIIEEENRITAEEKQNLKTCPDCGAPYPLFSHICGFCGHVLHAPEDSDLYIKNLTSNIDEYIARLKSAPKPTFFDVLKFRFQILMLLAAALLLVLAFTHSSGAAAGWSIVCLLIAVVALLATKKEDSPVAKADAVYYDALYNQEMFSRTIDTLYGENPEARQRLKEYENIINVIRQNKDSNRKKITVTFLTLIIAGLIPVFVRPNPVKSYQENQNKYSEIYQLSEERKTVRANGENPVSETLSQYLKCESPATVSIDVENDNNDLNDFKLLGSDCKFRLRISGIRLVSTGKKLPDAKTSKIAVTLFDKNSEVLETGLGLTVLENIDYDKKSDDNLIKVLENGSGSYYAEFVSQNSGSNIRTLKEVMDKIEYFSVTTD